MSHPKHTQALSDAEFPSKVQNARGLVLVDFWAAWCGPCRQLGPTLEQVAEAHADSVPVYKVDVDENPASAAQFGVKSIPTVILFKDGVAVERIVGAHPRERFEQAIQSRL